MPLHNVPAKPVRDVPSCTNRIHSHYLFSSKRSLSHSHRLHECFSACRKRRWDHCWIQINGRQSPIDHSILMQCFLLARTTRCAIHQRLARSLNHLAVFTCPICSSKTCAIQLQSDSAFHSSISCSSLSRRNTKPFTKDRNIIAQSLVIRIQIGVQIPLSESRSRDTFSWYMTALRHRQRTSKRPLNTLQLMPNTWH